MAVYAVTTSNWNDPAFWSGITETVAGHTLDLSALPSGFTAVFDPAGNQLTLNDGSTNFVVLDSAGGGVSDATLGGGSLFSYFTTFLGSDGNDTVLGDGTHDVIDGSGGNDLLSGGGGNDTLSGGDGINVLEGGDGNDSLIGNAAAGGHTFLVGDAGSDTLDGSTGVYDIASYYDATIGVSIDLLDSNPESGGDAAGDVLIGIEQIDGSNSAGDFIRTDDTGTQIKGWAGNDTLFGGGGNDRLLGGDGADYLAGQGGADQFWGGTGADTMDGGDNADLFHIESGFGSDFIQGGEGAGTGADDDTLDFSALGSGIFVTETWNEQGVFTDGTDTGGFNQIEAYIGTEYGDYFDATAPIDGVEIDARSGNDTILGSAGADSIEGGDGADFIKSGSDADTLSGGAGNDTLLGEWEGDSLLGGAGNDSLDGGIGDDTLRGEAGDDTLSAGYGSDVFDGGADTDTLIIDGTQVDGFAFDIDLVAGTDMYGNTYVDIENIIGGDAADTLSGDGAANRMEGRGDDDVLLGGGGSDTLLGGVGADTIEGGAGDDAISGDSDGIYQVSAFQMGVNFSVTGGTFEGGADGVSLSVTSTGTATFMDDDGAIGGDSPDETFTDAGQLVVLNGQTYPVLFDDTASFTNDATGDTYVFAILDVDLNQSGESGQAGEDGTILIQIGGPSVPDGATLSAVPGSTSGNPAPFDLTGSEIGFADSLEGGVGKDTLDGGRGDDTLIFSEGDSVTGGGGDDTFVLSDYSETGSGTVTLSGGGDDETLGGGDTLKLGYLADMASLNITATTTNASGNETYAGTVQMDDGSTIAFSGMESVVCFAKGTMILTPDGEIPIEHLRRGDQVVTRDNGPQSVLWIGLRALTPLQLHCAPGLRPIYVAPDMTLGTAPLIVSPQHGLLLQLDGEEVLVRARHLAALRGGKARVMQGCRAITYLHLMFEAHQIIFANGAAAESFYPGVQALRALRRQPLHELFTLLPELATAGAMPVFGPTSRKFAHARELPDSLAKLMVAR